MFHALTSLFIESAAVVLLVSCLFWAVTGVVASDYSGRSRVRGALLGGLLPLIGWAIVLIPPRRTGGTTPAVDAGHASPPWLGASCASLSWAEGTTPSSTRNAVSPWAEPTTTPPVTSPAPQPMSQLTRRRLDRPHVAVTAAGGLAVAFLIGGFVEPWLRVGTTVVSDAYAGGDTFFSAAPLAIGVVLMGLAVGMHARRPHGAWCVVGSLVATTNLLLGMQIWLFSTAVGRLLSHVSSVVHSTERVSVGLGAGCLIGSGLAGLAWSLLSLLRTEGA